MRSYTVFDLFAAWFSLAAKPRRYLSRKIQEALWTGEQKIEEKRHRKEALISANTGVSMEHSAKNRGMEGETGCVVG